MGLKLEGTPKASMVASSLADSGPDEEDGQQSLIRGDRWGHDATG